MKKVDFDNYANKYNDIMQNQHRLWGDISYYSEYKIKILLKYFDAQSSLNIVEYGCGIGRNLPYFQKYFPNASVFATDISKVSLSVAKKKNKNVTFFVIEDANMFYEKFDLIFIAVVYHHVHPTLRSEVTKEVYRLCKSMGKVAVFEHNPYNILTRKMVKECEFDADAVLLTRADLIKLFNDVGFVSIGSNYTLFIPPRFKMFSFVEKYLGWLPLGGQYYVIFKKDTAR